MITTGYSTPVAPTPSTYFFIHNFLWSQWIIINYSFSSIESRWSHRDQKFYFLFSMVHDETPTWKIYFSRWFSTKKIDKMFHHSSSVCSQSNCSSHTRIILRLSKCKPIIFWIVLVMPPFIHPRPFRLPPPAAMITQFQPQSRNHNQHFRFRLIDPAPVDRRPSTMTNRTHRSNEPRRASPPVYYLFLFSL